MNNKRKWIFRGCTLLFVLLLAGLMFLVGRGHTIYIDNKTLEYNGESYSALERSEVWVNGERLSKLSKRDRTMTTTIGNSFEMKLINTEKKGDDPTEVIVKLSLPYGWDGILVNIPGYLAGLPQEAWLSEFIIEPTPMEEDAEEPAGEDDIPTAEF